MTAAPDLRSYRISLPGSGAVWVTADSRRAACDLAERVWTEHRSILPRGTGLAEILDEYDDSDRA
jgi:hypothetical protein